MLPYRHTRPLTLPPRSRARQRRTSRRRVLYLIALLALIAFFFGGFVQGRRLAVTRVGVPLGLAAPLRVALLSDLHLGARSRGLAITRRAVAETMQRHPDVIILGGDFVSSRAGINRLPEALRGLRAPLGVYAVMGNHDRWTDAEAVQATLEACDVHMLVNDSVLLRSGRARVALVGVDDLWTGKVDMDAAWSKVPRGGPAILVSHNPDAALDERGRRARLILSGHTHAGVTAAYCWMGDTVRRTTGRRISSVYGSAHPYGLIHESWGWIYVTSGVTPGYTAPRWYTRPEVAIIEVR